MQITIFNAIGGFECTNCYKQHLNNFAALDCCYNSKVRKIKRLLEYKRANNEGYQNGIKGEEK